MVLARNGCCIHLLDSPVSKLINEKFDEVDDKWIGFWRNCCQWVSSGWLWWVWLSHDVALNIAVYLPRQLDVTLILNRL